MLSYCNRHQRIYMTNQLMDSFYVGYLLEYCLKNVLFRYLVNLMQNQTRSTK